MLELFYIYGFYFRKVVMIWEGKIDQTDYDQLTVCRWPLGRYFKKQKSIFNEQKNAPNVFLN